MGKYDKYLEEEQKTSKYADIVQQYAPKPKGVIAKALETISGPKGKTATGETKVGSFLGGLVKAPFKIGVNLYKGAGQLSRLVPGDQSADPNSFYNKSQTQGKQYMKEIDEGVDPIFGNASKAYPTEAFLGDLALPMGAGMKAEKYVGKGMEKLVEKFPALAGRIASKVIPATAGGAGYDVSSEGKLGLGTALSLGLSGVVQGGLKGLEMTTGINSSTLAKSMRLDNVLSPKAKGDIASIIGKGKESVDDVNKWFRDRKIQGSLPEIKVAAEKRIQDAKDSLSEFFQRLAPNPKIRINNPAVEETLTELRKAYPKLKDTDRAIVDKLEKEFIQNGSLSALGTQELKQSADDLLNMYTSKGEVFDNAARIEDAVGKLRGELENIGKKYGVKVKELNQEIRVGNVVKNDIYKREIKKTLLKLGSIGGTIGTGSYLVGTAAGHEHPLRNALIATAVAVGGGMALQNPAVSTKLANWMDRMTPKDISAIDSYIKTKGKNALPQKIIDRIVREIDEATNLAK